MDILDSNIINADTEILHVSKGLQYCAGDKSQYFLLLNMFLDTVDKRIQELDSFRVNGDINNYSIKVHALKSMARGLGADALADCAYQHELKSKEGSVFFIADNWNKLLDLCNQTVVDMRCYVNEVEVEPEKTVSTTENQGKLSQTEQDQCLNVIRDDVANFNFADASLKIERMLQYALAEDVKNRLTMLEKAVGNFDYIKSAEILEIE